MEQRLNNYAIYGFAYPFSQVAKLIPDFHESDPEYSLAEWLEYGERGVSYSLRHLGGITSIVLGICTEDIVTLECYNDGGSREYIELGAVPEELVEQLKEDIRGLGLAINALPKFFITSTIESS